MDRILKGISKPTLIVDLDTVKKNIKNISEKALRSGTIFRPHFKTHQSAQIGELFKSEGTTAITVSSIDMAIYFANAGWDDITVAFPANPREVERINEIAANIKLNLLVESVETALALDKTLQSKVDIWIEIDTGSFRTGVLYTNPKRVLELARLIGRSKKMYLAGLLTHAGHTYQADSRERVKKIYREMIDRIYSVKEYLRKDGFDEILLSIGDTPTASIVSDFSEVDEIRPGNFVFYDVTQLNIGSCNEEDIAMALAAPVVSKHRERNEIVVHGGAVHLSKESTTNSEKIFGLVALPEGKRWGKHLEGCYVKSLSQEHGVIKLDKRYMDRINIGDIILILPVHSCLTANLMRTYITLDGKTIETMNSAIHYKK